ncbi:MAG: hypothetical protein R3C03_24085 [Pirellulaceae bacterium]
MEPAIISPPRIWTTDEAKKIVSMIDLMDIDVNCRKPIVRDKFQALMRATVALWAYTGCRNKAVMTLERSNIHEISPTETVLVFRERKTGKVSTIPMHKRLLLELENVRRLFPSSKRLIPWHIQYRAISKHHEKMVRDAELPKSAQNPPKYWRKWFANALEVAGYKPLQSLAQGMLNHSSPETTSRYYSNAASVVIPFIPDIFETE